MASPVPISLCGGPEALCGPEFPCCEFEEGAYGYALTREGSADPCEARFWSVPKLVTETGRFGCEYEGMDFDEWGWVSDIDPFSPTPPNPWDEEYWSDRLPTDVLGPCAQESPSELRSRCGEPPGIWRKTAVPEGREAWEQCGGVFIKRSLLQVASDSDRAWDRCDEPLLQSAWATLRTNLDLVRWAMCAAEPLQRMLANGEAQRCAIAYLEREDATGFTYGLGLISPFDVGLPLTIVLNRELAGGPLMFAGFWDAAIHVNASAPPWENATTMFCGGDQARRNCAVIDLAASLFHEMLHVCGATLGPGHGGNTGSGRVPDACDFTYVAENNLRWALGVRFGVAEAGPSCCKPLGPTTDTALLGGPIPDRPMVDNFAALEESC